MSETVQPGAPAPERKAEGDPVEGEPRLEARARVLVVEDEHELRELIARWLETKGYIVTEAADGQDAVDLLAAGLEPDVILLDLGLPRMDGRAFLDWMRAQPKHAHRRVVVASAYLDDLPPVDADKTFAKPFRPDRLAAELDRLTSE